MEVSKENTKVIVANMRADGQNSRADYVELLQKRIDELESVLTPVAADGEDSLAFELDISSELYQRRQALIEAARRR